MTVDDVAAVAALEKTIQTFPWTSGHFHDSLIAGHEGWLQREAGEVLAFAVTMTVVDELHLLVIGVAASCQRSGLGTALLDFLLERARRASMGRMLLEVRVSNQGAIDFYRHSGFAEIGRRRGYYPASLDKGGRENAMVMARLL